MAKAPGKKAEPTFSAEEKAAMREYAAEKKGQAKGSANAEADLLAKIAEMTGTDKTIAEKVHKLVRAAAPGLTPKTWYGMPAYANADGKVVCFLQPAGKFKARYATLGFNDAAKLDDGNMWPTVYAITRLTAAEEARITALVKTAVG
mgnify:FL=1